MTDSKARIDPRYDPRYQRGYVGGETDAPPHAESPPPTSPVVAPVPVTREPREQVESRPARLEPERQQVTEPHVVAEPGAPNVAATAAAGQPARVPTDPTEPADAGAAVGVAAEPTVAGATGAAAPIDLEPVDPEPVDPESDLYARSWLAAGWLFSGAILAAGIWWAWTAAIDPRYYTGLGTNSDAFMYLQWSVPPSMVMIGALGVVVVTTFAGMHQLAASAARGADRALSAFPRVPAAYALAGIAIAGLIATFWLGGLVADGQDVMWTETGPREDQLTIVALSRVGEVAGAPVAGAAFAAVIGLVLLGVQSARTMRTTRRAG